MLMLHEVQRRFAVALIETPDADLLALIDDNHFGPAVRLSIYKTNVLCRLTVALASSYPVVCALVGHGFFDYAATTFVRQALPTAACLNEYGGRFRSFLESFPPAAGVAYLSDVARLEWLIGSTIRTSIRGRPSDASLHHRCEGQHLRRLDAHCLKFSWPTEFQRQY